jgi:hypothetical protein
MTFLITVHLLIFEFLLHLDPYTNFLQNPWESSILYKDLFETTPFSHLARGRNFGKHMVTIARGEYIRVRLQSCGHAVGGVPQDSDMPLTGMSAIGQLRVNHT